MEGSSKVIKIVGDTTQYLSSIKTIEQANSRMLQHMGAESASVAKVVSSNLAKIGQTQIFDPKGTQEQVKVLSELNTVVQMTDGTMGTFKESMVAMGDGSTKVSASYKELASSAKNVGSVQDGLVGKSSQLATNFGSVADTTQKFSNELKGFGGITRVVGQNVTEMSNGMTKTGVVVKTASGNFVQLRETVKTLPNGIQQVTRSAKDVSAQFNKTAIEAEKAKKSNQSLGESLAFITKRALITIPAWMVLRSVWMGITRTISGSIKFLIDWEYQMAQIRIVNNATASEMKTLSSALLSIGKDFGIATDAMGEASKLYSQQGRAMNEIIPLMRTTAKLSLLTGNTMTQSVEDLTAILKAFNISAENSVNIVDSMTNVMLRHAVTAQDLASAYKQTASTASALGVSFSELTGYITAIKAVTRDSGSKIGLSLRTMFSRITTSSAQAIQNLASVPLYLDNTGKATFSVTPRMRNLGSIISELALKFNSLGNAQQSQLASLVGGVRRQNQVFALFNNFTEAVEAQTDSLFGLGRADKAVETITGTAKIGIESLKNAWASFVDSVSNTAFITDALKSIANAVSFVEKLLAPDKANFKARNDAIAEQNDGYARQIQLADGVNEVLKKSKELDELMFRATPEQIKNATELLNIYKTRAEDALKLQGVSVDFSKIVDIKSFISALENVKSETEQLRLDGIIGQQINNIESDILATGQTLADTFRSIRIGDYGSKLGRGQLTGDAYREVYELARELDNLDAKFKKGIPLDISTFEKLNKILNTTTALTDEQRLGAQRTLKQYELQSEKLSDIDKTKKDIVKVLEEEQKRVQSVVLDYEKQQKIANIILDDYLKRLQLQGKTNAEILKAEILRRKQLGLDQNEIDNLQRKLALERERSKEKRLQGKIGSESEKLFDIAQEFGVDIAKQIGDVLAGEIDFSNFIRRGGEAVDVFKEKFDDVFKQQQMEAFFKGNVVPGLESLRGGFGINIAEQGLRGGIPMYDPSTEIRRQRAEAEILKTQTPIQQQLNVDAPVNMEINVNADTAEEVGDLVVNRISQELPTVGSKLNRALTSALYNKQTNTV